MLPLVTVSDIREAAIGLAIPSGDAYDLGIARLIRKAGIRLASAVPALQQRLADGTLAAEAVEDTIEDIVIRYLRNPQGIRQETVDDYTYILTDGEAATLDPTADEIARLSPDWTKSPTGAVGSIQLAPSVLMVPGYGC